MMDGRRGTPIFSKCCFAADFFIFKRLAMERQSVVKWLFGLGGSIFKTLVCKASIAGWFCGCYLDLHWTNDFWLLGVGVNYEKVVIGLLSSNIYVTSECWGAVVLRHSAGIHTFSMSLSIPDNQTWLNVRAVKRAIPGWASLSILGNSSLQTPHERALLHGKLDLAGEE